MGATLHFQFSSAEGSRFYGEMLLGSGIQKLPVMELDLLTGDVPSHRFKSDCGMYNYVLAGKIFISVTHRITLIQMSVCIFTVRLSQKNGIINYPIIAGAQYQMKTRI